MGKGRQKQNITIKNCYSEKSEAWSNMKKCDTYVSNDEKTAGLAMDKKEKVKIWV